jgi:hypothetical protein
VRSIRLSQIRARELEVGCHLRDDAPRLVHRAIAVAVSKVGFDLACFRYHCRGLLMVLGKVQCVAKLILGPQDFSLNT